jgi:hypothetical protein
VKLDPQAGLSTWEGLPDSSAKTAALMGLVSSWPRSAGFDSLVQAYQRLEFPDDRESYIHGLGIFLRTSGYSDAELKAIASTQMPERIGDLVDEALGRALSPGTAVSDLVRNEGAAPGLTAGARFSALDEAIETRPAEVAEALLTGGTAEVYERVGSRLVGQLVRSDTVKAAAWVEQLPAGPMADRLVFEMVELWLQSDPRSASAYALRPSDPRVREVAALAVRSYLMGKGDDEGAAKWAAQVTSADLRVRLGPTGDQ